MIEIRRKEAADRDWVDETITKAFASPRVAARGRLYQPALHEGFIARLDNDRVGLATFVIDHDECELTSIVSTREGHGVGSALLEALGTEARRRRCKRIWLITTNDNLSALRFYQRRGFSLAAVYRGAVDDARRRLKPEIPSTGQHGIPMRDEIELESRTDCGS